MSAEVSKFVAAFKQIEDHVASGWGPEDIFQVRFIGEQSECTCLLFVFVRKR